MRSAALGIGPADNSERCRHFLRSTKKGHFICEVEGIALAQVRSIQVDDDEISVRIERPGGSSSIVTYPVGIFAGKSIVR